MFIYFFTTVRRLLSFFGYIWEYYLLYVFLLVFLIDNIYNELKITY